MRVATLRFVCIAINDYVLDLAAHRCYWEHIAMFPHLRYISNEVIQALSSELSQWIVGT